MSSSVERIPAARSPEIALLLACARAAMRTADREGAIAAIRAGVDWGRAIRLAEVHGVLPLLNRHLADVGPSDAVVPPDAALALSRAARRWAAHGHLLADALATLLGELAAHDIPAVSFKGPLLAQRLYGSFALRQSVDLDILLRPADVPRAGELLLRRGFSSPTWNDAELDAMGHETSTDVIFHAPPPTYAVELHHALQPPEGDARFGLDEFADRLTETSLLGRPVLTFAAEDLLAYLCVHGDKHAWGRIGWVCDVAELIRGRHVTDWARVADAARRLRAERRVRAGVLLARTLLGAPVPDDALGDDRWARSAVRAVVRRTVERGGPEPTAPERIAHQLRTDPGPGARVRRVAALLRPSVGERVAVPLPRLLRPLHVLVRPFRLLATYGPVRWLQPPSPPGERRR